MAEGAVVCSTEGRFGSVAERVVVYSAEGRYGSVAEEVVVCSPKAGYFGSPVLDKVGVIVV